MINVHYFARYRETLGVGDERLSWDEGFARIDDLRRHLLDRGGNWQVLAERNLMCARNQELCGLDEPLVDGDEIAFFPTVTGG